MDRNNNNNQNNNDICDKEIVLSEDDKFILKKVCTIHGKPMYMGCCKKTLCLRCLAESEHRRHKAKTLIKLDSEVCDEHKEPLMACWDCKEILCIMCFENQQSIHKDHDIGFFPLEPIVIPLHLQNYIDKFFISPYLKKDETKNSEVLSTDTSKITAFTTPTVTTTTTTYESSLTSIKPTVPAIDTNSCGTTTVTVTSSTIINTYDNFDTTPTVPTIDTNSCDRISNVNTPTVPTIDTNSCETTIATATSSTDTTPIVSSFAVSNSCDNISNISTPTVSSSAVPNSCDRVSNINTPNVPAIDSNSCETTIATTSSTIINTYDTSSTDTTPIISSLAVSNSCDNISNISTPTVTSSTDTTPTIASPSVARFTDTTSTIPTTVCFPAVSSTAVKSRDIVPCDDISTEISYTDASSTIVKPSVSIHNDVNSNVLSLTDTTVATHTVSSSETVKYKDMIPNVANSSDKKSKSVESIAAILRLKPLEYSTSIPYAPYKPSSIILKPLPKAITSVNKISDIPIEEILKKSTISKLPTNVESVGNEPEEGIKSDKISNTIDIPSMDNLNGSINPTTSLEFSESSTSSPPLEPEHIESSVDNITEISTQNTTTTTTTSNCTLTEINSTIVTPDELPDEKPSDAIAVDVNEIQQYLIPPVPQKDEPEPTYKILIGIYNKKETEEKQWLAETKGAQDPNRAGAYYTCQKRYQMALEYYSIAAKDNDIDAMVQMGKFYMGIGVGNDGVPQNYKKVLEWAKRAAYTDSAKGLYFLGTLYKDGLGNELEKDVKRAVNLFRESAKKGYSGGVFELGICHSHAIGVTQDIRKGLLYIKLSANKGNPNGCYALGQYCYNVSKDMVNASKWFIKTVKLGYSRAFYDVGNCFRYDSPPRYSEAYKCYIKAAFEGEPLALLGISELYSDGQGVQKSYIIARMFLIKASQYGVEDAIMQFEKLKALEGISLFSDVPDTNDDIDYLLEKNSDVLSEIEFEILDSPVPGFYKQQEILIETKSCRIRDKDRYIAATPSTLKGDMYFSSCFKMELPIVGITPHSQESNMFESTSTNYNMQYNSNNIFEEGYNDYHNINYGINTNSLKYYTQNFQINQPKITTTTTTTSSSNSVKQSKIQQFFGSLTGSSSHSNSLSTSVNNEVPPSFITSGNLMQKKRMHKHVDQGSTTHLVPDPVIIPDLSIDLPNGQGTIEEYIKIQRIMGICELQVKQPNTSTKVVYENAIKECKTMKNYSPAITYMGLMYSQLGEKKESYSYFKKASKLCHPRACFQRAQCLMRGLGTKVNIKKALFYAKLGASNGYAECFKLVGLLLCDTEFFDAISWLRKYLEVVNKKDAPLAPIYNKLGQLYALIGDFDQSFKCHNRAWNGKDYSTDSAVTLGSYYYYGISCTVDYSMAGKLYEYAGQNGWARGYVGVGLMFLRGNGRIENKPNLSVALVFFHKAAITNSILSKEGIKEGAHYEIKTERCLHPMVQPDEIQSIIQYINKSEDNLDLIKYNYKVYYPKTTKFVGK
ncbi:hypothetical protein DLAC_00053 [Tieghemostelium lacteum]|uniref:B box-type domain-containing protein n=1 Tax=Tieghemostelium lacteum TaxID=361077 RepID=A0A152A8P9_TIELA|nr:hypothetical protein DLAC_00053 [Tieghemostelium lacteum]|eukprot:KYR02606.1 hypothetical protein DLAC_00053 [Tieghemostelium lacteum]